MPNGLTGYRRTARLFHWGVALLVLLMIPAGLVMTTKGLDRTVQDTLFLFHKNVGVLLFFLVLGRLIYRLRHAPPPLPATLPAWQRRAADLSHKGLYALLLLMPVFGYVLEGELTVDYGDKGQRVYRTGEGFAEAIHVLHNGRNTGSGKMRVLALFMAAEGLPTTIPAKN